MSFRYQFAIHRVLCIFIFLVHRGLYASNANEQSLRYTKVDRKFWDCFVSAKTERPGRRGYSFISLCGQFKTFRLDGRTTQRMRITVGPATEKARVPNYETAEYSVSDGWRNVDAGCRKLRSLARSSRRGTVELDTKATDEQCSSVVSQFSTVMNHSRIYRVAPPPKKSKHCQGSSLNRLKIASAATFLINFEYKMSTRML